MTAHDERPGVDVRGDVDAADIRDDEQPAPAAREIAADELAEAERELDAAREALGYIEHGADDTAALERHAAALNRRNALRKADELTKAERWARKYALYAEMAPSSRRMVTLMAEYDERGRERDAARAELAAAPEGVDAADEQRGTVLVLRGQLNASRSMLAASRQVAAETADELTTAQAAIQRVRAECEKAHLGGLEGDQPAWKLADRILRALDGDTTEERR